MIDDESMDTLAEVAELLFGDGAYELVTKMSPTSSDLSTQQAKRERTQAQVGLASNVVGLGAGIAGTAEAYGKFKDARAAKAGKPVIKVPKKAGKYAALGAGALLGLQVANMGGDVVANRVLARSAKKKDITPKKRSDYALAKNRVGDAALKTGLFATGVGATYEGNKLYRKKRGKQRLAKGMPSKRVLAGGGIIAGEGIDLAAHNAYLKQKKKKAGAVAKRHEHSPTCRHMRMTKAKFVASAIEGGAPHVKSAASKAGATGKPILIGAQKKIERKLAAKPAELDKSWKNPRRGSFRSMKRNIDNATENASRISEETTHTARNIRTASENLAGTTQSVRTAAKWAVPIGLTGVGVGGATGGYAGGKKARQKYDKRKSEHLQKSDDLDIVWQGEFAKFDTDKRQVFGWASIVELNGEPVVDLQGDFIPADEIEKAAYEYVQKSRRGGDMHRRDGENAFHASEMIESFMVTPEKVEKMGLPAGSLPTGWWVGYQVHDDDTWNLVKSGKRTGFSIHGRGKRADA